MSASRWYSSHSLSDSNRNPSLSGWCQIVWCLKKWSLILHWYTCLVKLQTTTVYEYTPRPKVCGYSTFTNFFLTVATKHTFVHGLTYNVTLQFLFTVIICTKWGPWTHGLQVGVEERESSAQSSNHNPTKRFTWHHYLISLTFLWLYEQIRLKN